MRYSFDAGDAATHKETQYYEMLGTRGDLAQGLEGGHRARAGPAQPREVRRGPLAAVPHRRGPLGGARPGRAAPREARGAQGAVARGGQEVRRAAAQRPRHLRVPRRSSTRSPLPASGRYTYYPGTSEVPEASAARTTQRLAQDPRRGRVHAGLAGRDRRPGLALRRASRCSSRTASSTYTYNFLGIPPEQRIVADAPTSGHAHRRASSSRRSAWASTTSRTGR